jgi:hypothetical protein
MFLQEGKKYCADISLREVAAYVSDRNSRSAKILWGFTTPDARVKMKKLYP